MERFDIDIRNFAFGGAAYGVLPSGKGCFVRGAAPGENVTVEVISEHARFVRAKLIGINKGSPERITPLCPLAGICPGCSFGHLSYDAELFWKQDIFKRFISGCAAESVILPAVGAPERFFWRNKIRLTVENGVAGYRGEDNVSLLPVESCPLVRKEINEALKDLSLPQNGSVELRFTPAGGVLLLDQKNREEIIYDTLPGYGDFPIPAGAFFQTNPAVASLLVDGVIDLIRKSGSKELVELHCGGGMFSLCAAGKIPGLRTTGAEITAASISCAVKAAKAFKLSGRCSFTVCDAARFWKKSRGGEGSLLLVDPPRTGLDRRLLAGIIADPPEYMIYVSCGPDTLQRDLKALTAAGGEILSTRLYDMFPATAHFESLTFLHFPQKKNRSRR